MVALNESIENVKQDDSQDDMTLATFLNSCAAWYIKITKSTTNTVILIFSKHANQKFTNPAIHQSLPPSKFPSMWYVYVYIIKYGST